MSQKAVIKPYAVLTAGDMSGNLTTLATNVESSDNIGYQIVYSGSPTGVFNIEGTIDGLHWTALTFSSQPTTANAPTGTLFNLNQLPYLQTRLSYTATSGSGSLTVYVMSKRLGG